MKTKSEQLFIQLQQLRLNAEATLDPLAPSQAAGFNADEILHELRLHQIELEMQNRELQRAQLALETSHAHYVELYHFSPIGYLTLTAEGTILEINMPGAALLGMERLKLMRQRFDQFIVEADKDRWYRLYLQAKHQNEKQSGELLLCRNDGSTVYVQLNCLYLQRDDAPPIARIALTDITERVQSEEALRVAAAVFDTQESMMVADAENVILRVNNAFSAMTGYSSIEAIGKTPHFLRSGQHDQSFYDALWATLRDKGSWQGEIESKRKDGTVFPGWLTITAVINTAGVTTHHISCLTDITLQKQAEKVLINARERLENLTIDTQAARTKVKQEMADIDTAFTVLYSAWPLRRKA